MGSLSNSEPFAKFATTAIHTGSHRDLEGYGAVIAPITISSTYVQSAPGEFQYEYSRLDNPSRKALEETLAALENGKYAATFGSGLAAVSQITQLVKAGDEVICASDCYGGTNDFFRNRAVNNGLKVTLVDCTDVDKVAAALTENTRLVWLESPANPTIKITDIKAVSDLVHAYNKDILVAVDNTFMSSYFQRPLDLGADISHQSLTKYMNGHCDVVMGAAVVNDEKLYEKLFYLQRANGAVPSPIDCFLVSRGLKTLHLRMREHMTNGLIVAKFLESHPCVEKVLHPGLPSHPQYELVKKQARGTSGMLCFYVKGGLQEAKSFLKNLKLIVLAVSLGGPESLVAHPATMTHKHTPKENRLAVGITDNLIRLSVGLETVEDLTADLDQALRTAVAV
ncbi:Cystathionine gamma-lyase [Hypsibius exemplaris]|uniref:cystathionine gamma-lyase n=1 Tax=Hypsibius exemplaris TaxID=2072580 RepID=A0A1W0WIU2_HYPEX|nr:Cystathionine gamma-lyase [Hypsibius exemplaris]